MVSSNAVQLIGVYLPSMSGNSLLSGVFASAIGALVGAGAAFIFNQLYELKKNKEKQLTSYLYSFIALEDWLAGLMALKGQTLLLRKAESDFLQNILDLNYINKDELISINNLFSPLSPISFRRLNIEDLAFLSLTNFEILRLLNYCNDVFLTIEQLILYINNRYSLSKNMFELDLEDDNNVLFVKDLIGDNENLSQTVDKAIYFIKYSSEHMIFVGKYLFSKRFKKIKLTIDEEIISLIPKGNEEWEKLVKKLSSKLDK